MEHRLKEAEILLRECTRPSGPGLGIRVEDHDGAGGGENVVFSPVPEEDECVVLNGNRAYVFRATAPASQDSGVLTRAFIDKPLDDAALSRVNGVHRRLE